MTKRKITIMYFVSGLISGGVERMIANWTQKLDNREYEFIVVYQHKAVTQCLKMIEESGCHAIRITARNENFIKNMIDSYRVIRLYHPDIVHSNMNLMNFCALIPAKLMNIKVRICHSHIADKKKNFLYRLVEIIFRLLNIMSSTINMACGEDAAKYLFGKKISTISLQEAVNFFKTGQNIKFRKNNVIIVNNAIDFEQFCYVKENFRNRYNLQEKIIIGHVGRFTEQKNQKRLLEIFCEYHKLHENAVLLIAGTGELKEQLEKYVNELGIVVNVIFLGVLEDMKAFYSSIDILLLPSLYEGFPVVALEIQAAGKPALFSDQIDSSSKITDLVHFVSLKKSNSDWAKAIDYVLKSYNNIDFKHELTAAGYNINEEIKKLDYLYRQFIKNI